MADNIQQVQDQHRQALIHCWNIPPASRVLEIGCGQGDTTRMLAKAVGSNGFVHAIDPAPGTYGAPTTLADARLKLLSEFPAENIKIDFETDVFSLPYDDEKAVFDYVVLSHCSWYFSSADLLLNTLIKARKYARKLRFAEWDTRINNLQQFAHYQAVMLQAYCNSFMEVKDSNIKTLFTYFDLLNILQRAGWTTRETTTIDSSYLQDGRWELMITLEEYPALIRSLNEAPQKTRELLQSNLQCLQAFQTYRDIQSLDTVVILAE